MWQHPLQDVPGRVFILPLFVVVVVVVAVVHVVYLLLFRLID
jgi:hypothetical protein